MPHIKNLLKFIGILLFAWILLRLDKNALLTELQRADMWLLLLSFLQLYAIYAIKAFRLHVMIQHTGLRYDWQKSWHLYMIGIFFATITPAKIGELGRAIYLKKDGLSSTQAIGIVILDRIADVVVIALITIGAVGILFGLQWSIFGIFGFVASAITLFFVRKKNWITALPGLLNNTLAFKILVMTIASWCMYFLWTITIARAVGIDLSAIILVASFTVAGIVAILPIAPSGLGTRDAALITLLNPFGITQEQAVAVALLMFVSIVLSGALGGFYWIHERK